MLGLEGPVVSAAVDVLISAAIKPLIAKAWRILEASVQNELKLELEKGIESLANRLNLLQDFLLDAEEKQSKDTHVRRWLDELEDVVYDIEDLLEDYAANIASQTLEKKPEEVMNRFLCCFPVAKRNSKEYATRIKYISGRLEEIIKDRKLLGLQFVAGSTTVSTVSPLQRPETISFLADKDNIFGRSELKTYIMKKLLGHDDEAEICKDNGCRFSVLPIVGMGGIGKTTLAKLVYSDKTVQGHFHFKIWLCLSNNFDVDMLRKEIMETALQCDHHKESNLCNLDALQIKFTERMQGKRYLLVLDDAWSEDNALWDHLLEPLNVGAIGSIVMVTTRSLKVTDAMSHHMRPITLKGLSDDDIWKVFKNYAFRNIDASDSARYFQFEVIGKQISKKLKGSPMAAKSIGSLLSTSLDIKYWRDILRNDLWKNMENSIYPVLLISYQNLHVGLKRCFSFCSLFPKDYQFDVQDLVDLWTVEGFVQTENRMRIEDVGRKYFEDMKRRSFFQDLYASSARFIMHDLIHDLSQTISSKTYSWVCDTHFRSLSQRTRHISCYGHSLDATKLKDLCEFKKLRTLIFPQTSLLKLGTVTADVLDGWFKQLRYLRVLKLSYCQIRVLPDSIGDLKHLRYLDLSNNLIEQVPASIGSCSNLEVLNLYDCTRMKDLPNTISGLIHMRRLKASSSSISSLDGIGKLTSLLQLDIFCVDKRKGHKIEELKDLNFLHGTLHVNGLQNVEKLEEAIVAGLHKKEYLEKLVLVWSTSEDTTEFENEDVLENLRPHIYIRELIIVNNCGSNWPTWMNSENMPYLETIRLDQCHNWQVLPQFATFASLRSLYIINLKSLKRLDYHFYGCGWSTTPFPCLEKLFLEDNINLEEWEESAKKQCSFPMLNLLQISHCPRLKRIPPLPSRVQRLYIVDVGLTSLQSLSPCMDNRANENSTSSISSSCLVDRPSSSYLKILTIRDCPKMTYLGEGILGCKLEELYISKCPELSSNCLELKGFMEPLSSLRKLNITDCPNMTSLGRGILGFVLEELYIFKCPELSMDSRIELNGGSMELGSSVKRLEISECPKLVPSSLLCGGMFSSLEKLYIKGFHGFDVLLTSSCLKTLTKLMELSIEDCPNIPSSTDADVPPHYICKRTSSKHQTCDNDRHVTSSEKKKTSLSRNSIVPCQEEKAEESAVLLGVLTSLKKLSLKKSPKLLKCLLQHTTAAGNDSKDEKPLTTSTLTALTVSDDEDVNDDILHSLLKQNLLSLEELDVYNCSNITSLPEHILGQFRQLRRLRISGCKGLASIGLGKFQALHRLTIENCPNLIVTHVVVHSLPILKVSFLKIKNCTLQLLTQLFLQCIITEYLTIESFAGLTCFTGDLEVAFLGQKSLRVLFLGDCPDFLFLPTEIDRLSSLQQLVIKVCPKMQHLPDLHSLIYLQSLYIYYCPELKKRYSQEGGPCWVNISHISSVYVS